MAQFDLSIMLEYGLVGSDDKDALVEIINEWISEGWQPLGGPFVYEGDLCQAMVREKPKTAITDLVNEVIKARAINS